MIDDALREAFNIGQPDEPVAALEALRDQLKQRAKQAAARTEAQRMDVQEAQTCLGILVEQERDARAKLRRAELALKAAKEAVE